MLTGWTVSLIEKKNQINELSNDLFIYVELIRSIVTDEIEGFCGNCIGMRDQLLIDKAFIKIVRK